MNTKHLLIVLVMLVALALAYSSQSTLSPERGADHVFYGPSLEGGAFIGEEIAVGDFDGDGFQDFVSAAKWDNPETGGAPEEVWETDDACEKAWGTVLVARGLDTLRVCDFAGTYGGLHRTEWWELGWDSLDAGDCDDCYGDVLSPTLRDSLCVECNAINLKGENQGAVYVFKGGTGWSAKPHDTDLTITAPGGANTIVFGDVPGGDIYGGIASGDVDNDGDDELAMGAPGAGNGAVYVIAGASSWPNAIDLGDAGDIVAHVGHYLIGRDANDLFGTGLAMGRLDPANNLYDIAVVAREGDGPDGDPRTQCGEVYLFFGTSLPDTLSLSGMSDTALSGSSHVAVIYGPSAYSFLGNTFLYTCHPIHTTYAGPHPGGENPTGLAIGDWDGDGRDDLAISAGQAGGVDAFGRRPGDGAVYVIFGRPAGAANKLKPGNIIDLANAPDLNDVHAPDVRIVGKPGSALGAGIAFLDADGQGEAAVGSGGDAKDDLIMGAPEAFNGWGEVYIIFGDARATLTGSGLDDRDMANSADFDKRIRGEGFSSDYCTPNPPDSLSFGDQLGSHFSGNLDFDDDGYSEVGISGQEENYVFFVTSQNDWPDVTYLESVNEDYPDLRVVEFVGNQASSSNTIRFLDLDNADGKDLVFGGYDADNRSGAVHSGEMWVWKGQDTWKQGTVTTTTAWSGTVFVHGDVVVDNGATLTIEAGTDVWVWPKDPGPNLGADTLLTEIRVEDGALVVDGTEASPVRFLAWTMDGIESSSDTDWAGIWIGDDEPASLIDHAIIRNAVRGIWTYSSLTVTNSVIEDCDLMGIKVSGDGGTTDSLYAEDTVVRRVNSGQGIGVDVDGDNAAALLGECIVEDCQNGVIVENDGRFYAGGTVVEGIGAGVVVRTGGTAQLSGGPFSGDGAGVVVGGESFLYGGYAEFRNSYYAIAVDGDVTYTPTIELAQCTIDSSYAGVYVVGPANFELDTCDISDHETDGIQCYDGADLTILDCIIGDNGASGIRVDDSAPDITGNYIGENNGGITCQNYANPLVEANKVWNNNNGIAFVDDGNADMDPCSGSCPPCADGNSFKGNSGYHASNLTGATIDAECNYWGKTTPSAAKFYGSVDYTPYLSGDPLPTSEAPDQQQIDSRLPKTYRLTGNAPNPFNPVTTIRYEVPPPGGHVILRVYNVQGQLVRTLVDREVGAGYQQITWDGVSERGTEVASGVYFLEMKAPRFRAAQKIVMLK